MQFIQDKDAKKLREQLEKDLIGPVTIELTRRGRHSPTWPRTFTFRSSSHPPAHSARRRPGWRIRWRWKATGSRRTSLR